MKPIQIIESLIPWPILNEIAMVLERGSRKEGKGVLNCNRSQAYYLMKFHKHLFWWTMGVVVAKRFKTDKDSRHSHLIHCVLRLLQILGVELEEK